MAWAPIALAAASVAFSGFTQWESAKYQAAVASNNAKIAKANAGRASDAAQENQRRSDIEYAATIGDIRAQQSASGLDTLGRSQLAVRNRTKNVGRLAALDIRQQGEDEIRDFLAQEQSFRAQKKIAKIGARNAVIGTALKLGSVAADAGAFGNAGAGGSASSGVGRSIASGATSYRRRM